jgi:hypothetical protein
MGTPDTLYFSKPIPCPICNAPINSVQSHDFMDIMQSYYPGDMLDGSTVTGIIKTDLFCPKYSTHPKNSPDQYLYIVIWHHLYIGIAVTEAEAETMLSKFGIGDLYLLLDSVQAERAKIRSNLIGLHNIVSEYADFLELPPERQAQIKSGKKEEGAGKGDFFDSLRFASLKKYLTAKNPLKAIAEDDHYNTFWL